MTRLGILASGSASTANYVATLVAAGEVPGAKISCVVSSRSNVGAMDRMKYFCPVERVRTMDYPEYPEDPLGFGQRIIDILEEHGVTDVMQLGWLPHTPPNVVARYAGHIYNQHPGPLPEFGGEKMAGKTVHDAVLRFRKKLLDAHGGVATMNHSVVVAHRVIDEKDAGPVVKYAYVDIDPKDTKDTLSDRALPYEWKLMLGLARDIAQDTVREVQSPRLVAPSLEQMLADAKQEAIDAAQAKH